MPLKQTFAGSWQVIAISFKTVAHDPQIILYPLLAVIITPLLGTYLGRSIFSRLYNDVFNTAGMVVPHHVRAVVGLVTFSAFYAAFMAALFTCAVSAAVMARLERRSFKPLEGLTQVLHHFFRVARFAVLSVFLFPVGIYSQRRKLPKGMVGVLGSSLTLHMANLAPAILTTKTAYGATVRDSINILGAKWKEGLLLKVGMYATFTLAVILPKLIQHHFSPTASNAGWVLSLEFGASGLVVFKVINAIFTTVLYHQAKTDQEANQ